MRSLFHFRWLLTLVLGLGSLLAAHATHNLGGEISYTPVPATTAGTPRFHVLVRLYLDPTSPAKQETVTLLATRGSCNATSPDAIVSTILKNSNIPGNSLSCSATGTTYNYNTATYETDLDLPVGQWTLGVTLENRAGDIQNIANAVAHNCFLSASLNSALLDSSPRFQSTLLPYVCGSTRQRYSFGAFDADGDSLSYGFILPQEVIGGIVANTNCNTTLSSTYSPHFQLNTNTGELIAVPANVQQGRFEMAAQVNEFRRLNGQWQLIGFVIRDIVYVAYASTNQAPGFTGLVVNGGAARSPDQPIAAQPGQMLRLTLTAADADAGQQLRFSCDAASSTPGLSFTTLNATQAQLIWQVPATLSPGRYVVPIAVIDNGCPQNAAEDRTLVFVVSNTALAARAALPAEATAYPLPFHDQVRFTAGPNQAVLVVDALGRPVARLLSAADGSVQWQPAASLPAGLYLARTADGKTLARLLHD